MNIQKMEDSEFANLIKPFLKFPLFHLDTLKFLSKPSDFYTTCVDLLKSSQEVYISTLCFGTDIKSRSILEAIRTRKRQGKRTNIIIDKHRADRTDNLISLIYEFGIEDQFILYNTKTYGLLPECLQELFSVLHSKIYIFDQTILISGANIDYTYFTNRSDRYLILQNLNFSKFLISEYFIRFFDTKINNLLNFKIEEFNINAETLIAKFDNFEEVEVLKKIFSFSHDRIILSTAYPNFADEHLEIFSEQKMKIITASATANTFQYDSLIGKYIVESYTLSTIKMLESMHNSELYEYIADNETFHCKGLWCFGKDYVITVIGSTNFNKRSINRDIETNFVIFSRDFENIKKLEHEIDNILKKSRKTSIATLKQMHVTTLSKFGQLIANGFL